MTTDAFTTAARAEAEAFVRQAMADAWTDWEEFEHLPRVLAERLPEWARDHLARQEATDYLAHFPDGRVMGEGIAVRCRCGHESWARPGEIVGPIDDENNSHRLAERRHAEHIIATREARP